MADNSSHTIPKSINISLRERLLIDQLIKRKYQIYDLQKKLQELSNCDLNIVVSCNFSKLLQCNPNFDEKTLKDIKEMALLYNTLQNQKHIHFPVEVRHEWQQKGVSPLSNIEITSTPSCDKEGQIEDISLSGLLAHRVHSHHHNIVCKRFLFIPPSEKK